MLKGIPSIISPQLLCELSKMGHGDELVIADGNFPCESIGKNAVVIRADGHGVPKFWTPYCNFSLLIHTAKNR